MNQFQILKKGCKRKKARKRSVPQRNLIFSHMYCKPDLAQFDKEWELIPVKTRFDFLKRDRIIEEKKASYLVEWEEKNRPWTTPVYPTRAEILRRVRYKKSVEKLQDFFIKQQEYRVFEVLYESF